MSCDASGGTISQRPYYVGVTERRLLILKPGVLSGEVVEQIVADPLSVVMLEGARHGPLQSALALRRHPSGEVWRLKFSRMWRTDARAMGQALTGAA